MSGPGVRLCPPDDSTLLRSDKLTSRREAPAPCRPRGVVLPHSDKSRSLGKALAIGRPPDATSLLSDELASRREAPTRRRPAIPILPISEGGGGERSM